MPLYEYKCTVCGSTVEVLQKTEDGPPKTCQKCGGALVKLVSSPAIQFKGNGWYVTDYAKKASPEETGKAKPKPEDGKPAAKPEAPSSD